MVQEDKNILYGGEDSPPIDPHTKSMGELALNMLKQHGNKETLIDGITDVRLTSIELHRRVVQLAVALKKCGVKEGDAVAICSENRLEFPVVVFATIALGATLAPLNVTYTSREFSHALSLSNPKVLFVTESAIDRATKSNIKHIICFGKTRHSNVRTLPQFIIEQKVSPADIEAFISDPVDKTTNVAVILCSSGTTGLPKGVQLTQANVLVAVSQQYERFAMIQSAFEDGLTSLGIIPWFHAFGSLTMMGQAMCGARFVLLPKFEAKSFLDAIQKYKINMAFLVPPLMVFLAKDPIVDNYDLSSLMMIFCGAAPLSKETVDAVYARTNVFTIRQGFGMSEASLSLTVQDEEKNKPGSVGGLRPGVWGKVIDPETGKTLGPNQRGELCFKGTSIMKGYVGNAEATASTIDKDGWLHSGDIGFYDDDGEWFIVDRIKELIKYKGFQVPPAEIERLLLTHPEVRDTAVIGIPNEAAGELPLAFIVKAPGSNLTEKDLIDFVAKNASPAKRLHGGVKFIEEIPKNASGKILRRVLRERVKNMGKSKL